MKEQKNMLKVLWPSGLSMLLVAVFLCVSIVAFSGMNRSVAWLSNNQNVSANGISVSANPPTDTEVNLTSYAVSEISGTPKQYTLANEESYTLPTYDPNQISYSAYQEALVVVIEINPHKDAKISVALNTPNGNIIDDVAQSYISNCMQITPATLSSGVASISGDPLPQPQTFVTIGTGTAPNQKRTSIPLVSSMDVKAGTTYTLCYVIEYNQAFLNYLYSKVLDLTEMHFSNDISFVVDMTDSKASN